MVRLFPFTLATKKKQAAQEAVGKIFKSSTGKVLLMDNEPIIIEVATEILQHLGYEVSTAWDGEEAIELYLKSLEMKGIHLMSL